MPPRAFAEPTQPAYSNGDPRVHKEVSQATKAFPWEYSSSGGSVFPEETKENEKEECGTCTDCW